MRRILVFILVICILPSVAAVVKLPNLEFGLPAQAGPKISATEASWALLVFDSQQAMGRVNFIHEETLQTAVEESLILEATTSRDRTLIPQPSQSPTTQQVPASFHLNSSGISSVFVSGLNVKMSLDNTQLAILSNSAGDDLAAYPGADLSLERAARYDLLSGGSGTVLLSKGGSSSASVQVEEIRNLELHGFSFSCPECPDGNDRKIDQTDIPGIRAEQRALAFHSFKAAGGNMTVQGAPKFIVFGGKTPSLVVDGSIRLPGVEGLTCADCSLDAAGTLAVSGRVWMNAIQASGNNRASADVSGEIASARLGEREISPELLAGIPAATAATLGLVLLVKFLAVPLFTRLSKEEALEHPNRQRIFSYVQEHPGANFREVARETGIASGTVRHHLTVLERAGHLVEHAHQGTVRLFENHGKFDQTWSDVVLLREPPLAQIHAWLKENPNSPQKDILEAFEVQGWSRSTTQHRLARLVEGGVATVRLQGRLKFYGLAVRPVGRPVGSGALQVPGVPLS